MNLHDDFFSHISLHLESMVSAILCTNEIFRKSKETYFIISLKKIAYFWYQMIISVEDSYSWKDFMQRKTLEHLDVIRQDRQKCKSAPAFVEMLKENRMRLAETMPYFQSLISEFLSAEDVSSNYNEDGSFRFDANEF
jgi:hypothetical protein